MHLTSSAKRLKKKREAKHNKVKVTFAIHFVYIVLRFGQSPPSLFPPLPCPPTPLLYCIYTIQLVTYTSSFFASSSSLSLPCCMKGSITTASPATAQKPSSSYTWVEQNRMVEGGLDSSRSRRRVTSTCGEKKGEKEGEGGRGWKDEWVCFFVH
jgi:hypothetical protein